jgi:hypothetical protein
MSSRRFAAVLLAFTFVVLAPPARAQYSGTGPSGGTAIYRIDPKGDSAPVGGLGTTRPIVPLSRGSVSRLPAWTFTGIGTGFFVLPFALSLRRYF